MKKALLIFTTFLLVSTISSAQYGNVTTIAGDGTQGYSGDGGPATVSVTNLPTGIAIDNAGNIYFSEITNSVVRKIATDGTISTVAGMVGNLNFSGDGGQATTATLNFPQGLAVDASGNLYIADRQNQRIRKVDANGIITTVAGNGNEGDAGDGGQATTAELNNSQHIAVDNAGNIYISDWQNNKIRKVATDGIITTIAGTGNYAFSGDGGAATSAELKSPSGIVVDASGNVYFSDRNNYRVRKIDTNGIITTIAGIGGFQPFSGDGGLATDAELYQPSGLTLDSSGNIYIVDSNNQRIRKITTDGIINTIIGTGSTGIGAGGFNGDDMPGTDTRLNSPSGVAVDGAGNIYITDYNNQRIRKLAASTLSTADLSKVGIQIFPNPTAKNNVVTVRSQEVITSIVVFNAIGQKVQQINPNKTNYDLDISNTSSGLYYVKLFTVNNNLRVQKLIVN